jgi:hypothetical protein
MEAEEFQGSQANPNGNTSAAGASQSTPEGQHLPDTEPSMDGTADIPARLNGTRWVIEWQPMHGEEVDRSFPDVLTFDGGKVASELLVSEGFPPSRFTVAIGEKGVPVWESVQMNPSKGIVLIEGEVNGQALQGLISRHPVDGDSQDYIFVSRGGTSETSTEGSPVAVQVAPEATEALHVDIDMSAQASGSSDEAPKRKRKRWLLW